MIKKLHDQVRIRLRLTDEVRFDVGYRAYRYQLAQEGYVNLKQNFHGLGDHAGATWAYLRERRMVKKVNFFRMFDALAKRRFKEALSYSAHALSDQLVEWLCDYGEGIWHVLGWVVFSILVLGPLMFDWFGKFEWPKAAYDQYYSYPIVWQRWVYVYWQLHLYVIDTMTTADFAQLTPVSTVTRLLSGYFAFWGIFLAGLLGFVAGNKIRRS